MHRSDRFRASCFVNGRSGRYNQCKSAPVFFPVLPALQVFGVVFEEWDASENEELMIRSRDDKDVCG
eukprot:1136864-Pelagomonas_calceolata.AAC.7